MRFNVIALWCPASKPEHTFLKTTLQFLNSSIPFVQILALFLCPWKCFRRSMCQMMERFWSSRLWLISGTYSLITAYQLSWTSGRPGLTPHKCLWFGLEALRQITFWWPKWEEALQTDGKSLALLNTGRGAPWENNCALCWWLLWENGPFTPRSRFRSHAPWCDGCALGEEYSVLTS